MPLRQGSERGRERRSIVAVQIGQFALAGLIALLLVGLATSVASRRIGTREAIAEARSTTVIKAQGLVQPVLTDGVVSGTAAALSALDTVVRRDVLSQSLVRVKVWTADGLIVYSDEPRIIGATYTLGADERAAIDTGRIQAEVSDLTKPENRYDKHYGKLLEVYLQVRTPSGRPLLFEAYYRYELVSTDGDRLWRSFAPLTLGALVMLQLVQLPLAWSLARRLQLRQRERENLLQRALEASEVERRQIASDLHDSVVQDLAGVSYSLAAAARAAPEGDTDAHLLGESAEVVRRSIKELRSLVVDIYPPDFSEVTLRSALTDLLARAADRGLTTMLEMPEDVPGKAPTRVVRLIYRAAQEGLRNVAVHAEATAVTLRLIVREDGALLEVVDDGRGFDAAEREDRRRAGHIGLLALQGLIADASGTFDLVTAPGRGTTMRVEVFW